MLAAPGAWAQCTDNFNFVGVIKGKFTPVSNLLPFGTGSGVSGLVSTINTVNTAFLATDSAFVSSPSGVGANTQGGGGWARVVGGSTETKSSSTATLNTAGTVVPAATGQQNCNTVVKQDYVGYQFGQDISILNVAGMGGNIHFGATAGYFEAKTKDTTPAGSYVNGNFALSTPSGTFLDTSSIPFAGLYANYTQGHLFMDGMARVDYYGNSITDSSNGLASQSLDAKGYSLTGNVGYNIPLGTSGWFVEPSGGIVVSTVSVDRLSVPGLNPGNPFSSFAGGSVVINDIESRLARGSVTIGTNFSAGGITWQPYATASVYHEYAGNVSVTSTAATSQNGGNAQFGGIVLNSSIGRIGTYAQFGLGTAAVFGDSGWLGYARVDYKTGDNIEGYSGTAGLRYQFGPRPSRPLSIKDSEPSPEVEDYNWTGIYAGAMFGALWGNEDWTYQKNGAKVDPALQGWLLGGQAGYNYQVGRWVLGIEGEYAGTSGTGGKGCPNADFFTCQADIDNVAALSGRLGLAWQRALVYAKAGAIRADTTVGTSFNVPGRGVPNSNTRINETSTTNTGWQVGGGVEFALTDRWSTKAEYMHYDLGSNSYVVDNGLIVNAKTAGDSVRIGVNYHFR